MVSQHCEDAEEQCQSGNTRLDVQVAFVDDCPQQMSKLLDRVAPKGFHNIPQVGTSAVLVIKPQPQKLVMPAQVAVQNQ